MGPLSHYSSMHLSILVLFLFVLVYMAQTNKQTSFTYSPYQYPMLFKKFIITLFNGSMYGLIGKQFLDSN
jgi:hypothetical protein